VCPRTGQAARAERGRQHHHPVPSQRLHSPTPPRQGVLSEDHHPPRLYTTTIPRRHQNAAVRGSCLGSPQYCHYLAFHFGRGYQNPLTAAGAPSRLYTRRGGPSSLETARNRLGGTVTFLPPNLSAPCRAAGVTPQGVISTPGASVPAAGPTAARTSPAGSET
jgi:hypothetical protein